MPEHIRSMAALFKPVSDNLGCNLH